MTVKLDTWWQKNKQLLKKLDTWWQKNKQLLKRTGIAIIVVLTVFALLVLIFYRAQLVLSYLQVLVWPCVVIFALIRYRRAIESLASQSKITLNFAGVSIETTVEALERSMEENLRGRRLSKEQWAWLENLRDRDGRLAYNNSFYEILVPLRNAGLITQYRDGAPADQLTKATEVGITALGKLLLEAAGRNQKSH